MNFSDALLMAVLSFALGTLLASFFWRTLVDRLISVADGYHANTKNMIEAMRAFGKDTR